MARLDLLCKLAREQVPVGRKVPICFLCRKPVHYATIDHVEPKRLARERWDRRSNKVVACLACNRRKADRDPNPAEIARLKALKVGEPEWYLLGDVPPADAFYGPPTPVMIYRPPRPGTIRLNMSAFREVCVDHRYWWDCLTEEQKTTNLSINSYRGWLRAELCERRSEFLLKEPADMAGVEHCEPRS